MHDAALNPLRKATTGNGTLPPAALAKWKSADGYGPALQALDEVTPGFSSRFDDAGKATQALLDIGAQHKAVVDTAQKEAARQAIIDNLNRRDGLKQANAADKTAVNALLAERKANDSAAGQADRASVMSQIADRAASDKAANAQSAAITQAGIKAAKGIVTEAKATPAAQYAKAVGSSIASTEVENAVGSMLKTGTDGATRMRGLVQSAASDPAALDGLRKAGTDWMVRNFTNADGSLSGAAVINFVKNNSDTLKELYPHDQVSTFGALARNAEENMRWRTSTAIKGGSDSVKNYLAALDKVEKGRRPPGHGRLDGNRGARLWPGADGEHRVESGRPRRDRCRNRLSRQHPATGRHQEHGEPLSRGDGETRTGPVAHLEDAGLGRRWRPAQLRPGAQAKSDRRADVDASGVASGWAILRRSTVKLSVLLTLDGLSQEQRFVEGVAEQLGANNVGSEMRDGALLDVQLIVSARFIERSRDRKSNDAVEGRHGGSPIEENHRGPETLNEGDSRDGFGVVGHPQSSIQGATRRASLKPAQDYGIARSQPSNQGPIRAEMSGLGQRYAS